MEKTEICKLFGCSLEQLNNQYSENSKGLKEMEKRAIKTGKKYNGYTATQLNQLSKQYKALSV